MSTSPGRHENIPPSLAQNAETFKGLGDIFNPLGELAATCMLNSTPTERAEDYRRMSDMQVHRISYALEYALLPPMLFGNDRQPRIPRNEAEQHRIIGRFARAMSKGTSAERDHYAPTCDRNDDPIFGLKGVDRTLRRYRDQLSLNPKDWQHYRDTYKQHCRLGTERHMLKLLAYRSREMQKHEPVLHNPHLQRLMANFPGRFESFLYAPLNINHPPELEVPPAIIVPIGEYGPDPADKLLRATVRTIERLGAIIPSQAASAAAENPRLLRERTARGGSEYRYRGAITGASVVGSTQEGVVGNQHALSQLTAMKVPRYDNPDLLLRDVILQGVLERYTQKSSMGVVAILGLQGMHFEHPLINSSTGLDISESQLAVMGELKKYDVAEALAEIDIARDRERIAPDEPLALIGVQTRTGILCPAAVKNGAVGRMARAMLNFYQML